MGDTQASTAELSGRWIQHGIRQKDAKQWTEALEAFDKALSLDTRNPQAWALKARVLDEMNNLPEAIRCYKTALELNPNMASTWNNKGYAFRKQQKYSAALECYREAVRLQPNYAKAWYNIGYILDKQGNYEDAIDAFSRAIELAPDNDKYVASRKAVEATWREFQKVFDQSIPSTSQSSLRDTTDTSPPLPRAPTAHHPSNREIATLAENPIIGGHSSNTNNGVILTPQAQSQQPDFNPFLDFETTAHEIPSVNTTTTIGAGTSLSRPHSPHLVSMEPNATQRDSVSMLHSSHGDSMPITLQHTAAGPGRSDESQLRFAYIPVSSSTGANSAIGGNPGSATGSHGHIMSQSRHSSASNSSPNLTSSGSLRNSHSHPHHHGHHAHSHGHQQPSHVGPQHQSKESRRTSSERPITSHTTHAQLPSHRTSINSASDETSSSSTGSNPSDVNASFSVQSSPHIHARSMSAASTTPRPSSTSMTHPINGNIHSSNTSTLNSGDASALLNTLQTSLMPANDPLSVHANTFGVNTSGSLGIGLIPPQKPLTSPDGSDSEHELVPVGLPRAKTYLEAIYTHLQCVKTVKDAEKLEKALEEMLAAVKVKRSFLASQIAASSDTNNQALCSCCWERPPEMVCIPCGHLCICEECKSKLRQKKCPICSQAVKNIYKVFK